MSRLIVFSLSIKKLLALKKREYQYLKIFTSPTRRSYDVIDWIIANNACGKFAHPCTMESLNSFFFYGWTIKCALLQTLILPCVCYLSILRGKVTILQVKTPSNFPLFAFNYTRAHRRITITYFPPSLLFSPSTESPLLHSYSGRSCCISIWIIFSSQENRWGIEQLKISSSQTPHQHSVVMQHRSGRFCVLFFRMYIEL